MIAFRWALAMVRYRWRGVLLRSMGLAIAIALVGSIGSFIGAAKATMTARAVRDVGVDWQVQAGPGADPQFVLDTVRQHHGAQNALTVSFGASPRLRATTGSTAQTTGSAVVLGVPDGFRAAFGSVVRNIATGPGDVLVFQQTASNLHVRPGDTVSIGRDGLGPIDVRVGSIVDLPAADSLFQTVGAQPGSQPVAPPDNVILVSQDTWNSIFGAVVDKRPDLVHHQVFAQIAHEFASDPAVAYSQAASDGRNLEASLNGAGVLANNVATKLDSARSDALYAQVLFLFLGAPGVGVAATLTYVLFVADRNRRRDDVELLLLRGAAPRQVAQVLVTEAALHGVIGIVMGLVLTAVVGSVAFHSAGSATWYLAAALLGAVLAAVTVIVPVVREVRGSAQRRQHHEYRLARWTVLAIGLLVSAIVVLRITGATSYNLVLVPEGVPAVSVNYWAFSGPVLLWLGTATGVWVVVLLIARFGRRLIGSFSGGRGRAISSEVADMTVRRYVNIGITAVIVSMSIMFAVSTSVFNETYRHQVEVDARLTNGADVTWSMSNASVIDAGSVRGVEGLPGVKSVSLMQHRYAYVGSDLQDLFGIDTATIGSVQNLSNSYFPGASASKVLSELRNTANGVLVSAETVNDYQLRAGDTLKLRLRPANGGDPVEVSFRFVGVVTEFPTAPKDSFLVANAAYVASVTGDASANTLLIHTGSRSASSVATDVQRLAGGAGSVTAVGTVRQSVGSSLTSVDLAGLTKVELVFAGLFAMVSTGVLLGLSLIEQRRSLAIMQCLGATRTQAATVFRTEAFLAVGVGGIGGVLGGAVLAVGLTKVLKGVFDPPPSCVAIPWLYLVMLFVLIVVVLVVTMRAVGMVAGRAPVTYLRRSM